MNLNNDQFLVLRRDGSIVETCFVLVPEDAPASSALQAYANAAEAFDLATPADAESLRAIAAEWGQDRPEPPTVRDNPQVTKAIAAGRGFVAVTTAKKGT